MAVGSASLVMAALGALIVGYSPLPHEMLPGHGEVLYGFIAGLGSVGSAIVISLTGLIVEATGSYTNIFYLMAGLISVAILIFLRFAQASRIGNE
jgi:nitrate/nitrite transporter NarK